MSAIANAINNKPSNVAERSVSTITHKRSELGGIVCDTFDEVEPWLRSKLGTAPHITYFCVKYLLSLFTSYHIRF